MVSNTERYDQLYQTWKNTHSNELQEKLKGDEKSYADTFRFGVHHALVFELRNVEASDADKAVESLREGSFTLTEDEWEAVSKYVLSQTYLAEAWES